MCPHGRPWTAVFSAPRTLAQPRMRQRPAVPPQISQQTAMHLRHGGLSPYSAAVGHSRQESSSRSIRYSVSPFSLQRARISPVTTSAQVTRQRIIRMIYSGVCV